MVVVMMIKSMDSYAWGQRTFRRPTPELPASYIPEHEAAYVSADIPQFVLELNARLAKLGLRDLQSEARVRTPFSGSCAKCQRLSHGTNFR